MENQTEHSHKKLDWIKWWKTEAKADEFNSDQPRTCNLDLQPHSNSKFTTQIHQICETKQIKEKQEWIRKQKNQTETTVCTQEWNP